MAFDLIKLLKDRVNRLGREAVAEECGTNVTQVTRWTNGASDPPLRIGQKILDDCFPEEFERTQQSRINGSDVVVFSPYSNMAPMSECLFELFAKHPGITILRGDGPNRAATRFFKSDAQWFVWIDDDMIYSTGDVATFNGRFGGMIPGDFAKQSPIERLTAHELPLISALHFDRQTDTACFEEARIDRGDNQINRDACFETPCEKIIETGYFTRGLFAVHRRVFEAILKKIPETSPDRHDPYYKFFTPTYGSLDETSAFCLRARLAAIQPHVDYGCVAARAYPKFYWPKDFAQSKL